MQWDDLTTSGGRVNVFDVATLTPLDMTGGLGAGGELLGNTPTVVEIFGNRAFVGGNMFRNVVADDQVRCSNLCILNLDTLEYEAAPGFQEVPYAFATMVVSQTAFAPKTEVTIASSLVAGVATTVHLKTYSFWNAEITSGTGTVVALNATNAAFSVNVTNNDDGTYDCDLVVTGAGFVDIVITVNGVDTQVCSCRLCVVVFV